MFIFLILSKKGWSSYTTLVTSHNQVLWQGHICCKPISLVHQVKSNFQFKIFSLVCCLLLTCQGYKATIILLIPILLKHQKTIHLFVRWAYLVFIQTCAFLSVRDVSVAFLLLFNSLAVRLIKTCQNLSCAPFECR